MHPHLDRASALATTSLSLLLLAGCTSQLSPGDTGPFGPVRSAVWLELTQQWPGGSDVQHHLLLHNRAGLCDALQQTLPDVFELQYGPAWDDDDGEALCADELALWTMLGDGLGTYHDAGAHYAVAYLGTRTGDHWEDEDATHDAMIEPVDGDYGAFDGWEAWSAGGYFFLEYRRYTDDLFALYREWTEYAMDQSGYCTGGEKYPTLIDEAVPNWIAVDWPDPGEATVTRDGDDRARIELDAQLVDRDYDLQDEIEYAGRFTGDVTVERCPVSVDTDAYQYLPFHVDLFYP